jgi:hypothetical protein
MPRGWRVTLTRRHVFSPMVHAIINPENQFFSAAACAGGSGFSRRVRSGQYFRFD